MCLRGLFFVSIEVIYYSHEDFKFQRNFMKKILFASILFIVAAFVSAQSLPSWVKMGMSEEQIRRNFNGELTLEIGKDTLENLNFLSGKERNQYYEFWIHSQAGLIQVMLVEDYSISNFNSIISSLRLRYGDPEFEEGEYYFSANLPVDVEEIVVGIYDGSIEIYYAFRNYPNPL